MGKNKIDCDGNIIGYNETTSNHFVRLYPRNDTKLFIYSSLNKKYLMRFLNEFKIPYGLIENKLSKSNCAYFGKSVNFMSLYCIAGIIKNFGYDKFYYNPNLGNEITLGSSKRNTIKQNKSYIYIDTITRFSSDTDINDIIDLIENWGEKVDIIDFGIKSGLISKYHLLQMVELEGENDGLDELFGNYDPHENFQWGGLSGEEAYTAYWNCD